ncbi:MAG: SPOR domain-containing protein [Burkholderiaceae bacterium]
MTNYKHKQAGGTFVGIIIGLIIGLTIAVVVALVITKTPVPFINRTAKEKTPDPTVSQMADPNKALYGNKDAVKDAAKEFAKEEAAQAAQQATTQASDNSKTPVKNDAKAPVIDKSTADKAATDKSVADKPKDAVAKADSLEDKWTFYLQVGAFRDQADAENAKAKLALQGFEAQVSERPSENGVLYRVRVGPFSQIDAMNKVRSKMSDNGIDVAVVRMPK